MQTNITQERCESEDDLGKTKYYANSFERPTRMNDSADRNSTDKVRKESGDTGKGRTKERTKWEERKAERSMGNAEKE